jgi:hypothetical protein
MPVTEPRNPRKKTDKPEQDRLTSKPASFGDRWPLTSAFELEHTLKTLGGNMTKPFSRSASRLIIAIIASTILTVSASAQTMFRKVNDFDGDGRADFAVTRAENFLMVWYIWQSTAGYKQIQWGLPADRVAAGDYDGDGRTDIAVARQTSGDTSSFTTYILQSQTNSVAFQTVTNPFDVAFFAGPQDYDGDGKSDPALFRSGTGNFATAFFYRSSRSGGTGVANVPGSVPVRVGDLTGDGGAEATTYLDQTAGPNQRLWIRNLATGELRGVFWGVPGDEPVPADFDGDGRGDIAVFRPNTGEWWWLRSSDNVAQTVRWGSSGDTTVPADYDGDGRTDHAVRRVPVGASNGTYYILGSSTGFRTFVWGLPSDTVVRY